MTGQTLEEAVSMKSKNVKSYEKMLPETRTMLQVGTWAWTLKPREHPSACCP